MWSNINDQVKKELEEEEIVQVEDTEGRVEKDETMKEKVSEGSEDVTQTVTHTVYERTSTCGIIETLADKLEGAGKELKEILKILQEVDDDEEVGKKLSAKFTSHALLKQMKDHTSSKEVMAGEWVDIALKKINVNSEKTAYRCLNSLLKLIMYDFVPYDMSYPPPTRMAETAVPSSSKMDEEAEVEVDINEPAIQEKGKKSKLSIGKYLVKSVIQPDGSRKWPCPYENCTKLYGSSGGCAGHLNKHLGKMYECPTCHYEGYSLDSYNKHTCFRGKRTQAGDETRGRKRKSSGDDGASQKKAKGEEEVSEGVESKKEKETEKVAVKEEISVEKEGETEYIILD